ncbi:MAG: GGDEF domain-containing protein [Bilophila wadsworthia]
MKAQLDPLTGLYNASSARKRIEASLQQPPSVGMHVLAVIDVNHFKQINDTCGHLTGDHALIETARRLGSMLNEGDIAGRIGGDEFIALFRTQWCLGASTLRRGLVPRRTAFHVRIAQRLS